MKLGVVILAAGQGTRMRSALPKVLHPLAGRPLLAHVLAAAQAAWRRADLRGLRSRRRVRPQRPGRRRLHLGRAGAAPGDRPCGDPGYARHGGDGSGPGPLRGCAPDPPGDPAAVGRRCGGRAPRAADHAPGGPHGVRAHRARPRRAHPAHRRAQGRHRRRAWASTRSTPASSSPTGPAWPTGWGGWATPIPRASTTSPTWSGWPWPRVPRSPQPNPSSRRRWPGSTTGCSSRNWSAGTRPGRPSA